MIVKTVSNVKLVVLLALLDRMGLNTYGQLGHGKNPNWTDLETRKNW